jgi:two-component system LytT family response regulator
LKVVIIDDEKVMHFIMKRMLAKIDEIEIVGNFQETISAFSYLVNHDVDLIFVDINMPGENGLEFAKRLRESGSLIRLVFVTSHKENALSEFDVKAYDYIEKPIDPDRLHKTVQRALSELLTEGIRTE